MDQGYFLLLHYKHSHTSDDGLYVSLKQKLNPAKWSKRVSVCLHGTETTCISNCSAGRAVKLSCKLTVMEDTPFLGAEQTHSDWAENLQEDAVGESAFSWS